MQISRIKIRNFRSIKSLDLDLSPTTVLVGPNNAGKTAILDAVRIALSRRWGQRGTGFTEHDIHRALDGTDPKTLPPVSVEVIFEEPSLGSWNSDMVAALEDIMPVLADGRNILILRVSCEWSEEKEAFDPKWEFLDEAGSPLTGKAQRATNLTGFFGYVPIFWLGALRDASEEFSGRSGHWGRLLKGVHIPPDLEAEALQILADLDARLIAADPRLSDIANTIGLSTFVTVSDRPGNAKLNMLPVGIEDILARAGVILCNEETRPWFPLGHHGQGLQSLAVIFLFQAAVLQQLAESERPGVEAFFAIEEPEAHLHPQAARTLWTRIQALPGQRLMTTHSPYFVQHVPLRDLRLLRLRDGCTQVTFIPKGISSALPSNPKTEVFLTRNGGSKFFETDQATRCITALRWFNDEIAAKLTQCYRDDANPTEKKALVHKLRHEARILPSEEDEEEMLFHGRRVRGEIFFARHWLLVEGVSEYLLLHALGQAMGRPLDMYGVAVIDFQQSGSAGIYPALADALGIPWSMVTDGDPESTKFRGQMLNRGFLASDLSTKFVTLPPPKDLEDELFTSGHEQLLRDILVRLGIPTAATLPAPEVLKILKKRKTAYMNELAPMVASDIELAMRMPMPFIDLVSNLRGAL